jgi:hypothetical protein
VALGWLWGAYPLAINTLWGGFDVALMWPGGSLRGFSTLDCPNGVPGIILTLHTFGEYLDFHPHIHALVADGLFVRPATNTGSSQTQAINPQPSLVAPKSDEGGTPNFHAPPGAPLKPLEELFRAKVIHLLVEEKLVPPERVQVLYSWKHSGFNVHPRNVKYKRARQNQFPIS